MAGKSVKVSTQNAIFSPSVAIDQDTFTHQPISVNLTACQSNVHYFRIISSGKRLGLHATVIISGGWPTRAGANDGFAAALADAGIHVVHYEFAIRPSSYSSISAIK